MLPLVFYSVGGAVVIVCSVFGRVQCLFKGFPVSVFVEKVRKTGNENRIK